MTAVKAKSLMRVVMTRDWVIQITKNKMLSYRHTDSPEVPPPDVFPVYSVDTESQAQYLLRLVGRKTYNTFTTEYVYKMTMPADTNLDLKPLLDQADLFVVSQHLDKSFKKLWKHG